MKPISKTHYICAKEPPLSLQMRPQPTLMYLVHHDPQRPEIRYAGQTSVNREAELEAPSRVACSDLLGSVVNTITTSAR